MFEAYIDESGTDESWCAVAGFIGPAAEWRSFEAAWANALVEAGVDFFHAVDFFGRRKPFRGWSGSQREALVDALTGALVRHQGLRLIASAVDTHAFYARTEHERVYLTGGRWDILKGKWTFPGAPSRPYYLPFANIFDRCHRSRHRVDMFHDQHNVYAEHARRLHAQAKLHRQPAALRTGIGELVFASKRERIPLQAADLAAYLTFYRVANGKQAAETDIARAMSSFKRFGTMIVLYDAASIESHLQASLPRAIREGRTPSQLRIAKRRATGLEKQKDRQRARK